MNVRRHRTLTGVAILAAILAGVALWAWAGSRDGGESARLGAPAASESDAAAGGTSDHEGAGSDETSSGVPGPEDAVPMETVDELFMSLEEMGLKPSMNETFTVEYDGSFERVRIIGVFEGEGTQTVVFELSDDGAWETVEE